MTPTEFFKNKPIGVIKTLPITVKIDNKPITYESIEYEVLDVQDDEYFVCNFWYDESKKKPLVVHVDMVETYNKI